MLKTSDDDAGMNADLLGKTNNRRPGTQSGQLRRKTIGNQKTSGPVIGFALFYRIRTRFSVAS